MRASAVSFWRFCFCILSGSFDRNYRMLKVYPDAPIVHRGKVCPKIELDNVVVVKDALLPKHGGNGKYGIHVHESVLASGDTETGVSIHLIDAE